MGNFIKVKTGQVLSGCDFYSYLKTKKGSKCEKCKKWFSEDLNETRTGCKWKKYFKCDTDPCTETLSIDTQFLNPSKQVGIFRKNIDETLADYRILIHSDKHVISFTVGAIFSIANNPMEISGYESLKMLAAVTGQAATQNGGWSFFSSPLLFNAGYTYTSVTNANLIFPVSNNPDTIGIFDLSVTAAKLAIVELNGDRTLANRLPTAQDLVLQGVLPYSALTTNGGTISPTDRMLNQVSPLETAYAESNYGTTSRRIVLAKGLTTPITSVKIICTEHNVGTGTFNLRIGGIWYDDDTKTIADVPNMEAQFQPIDEGFTLVEGASDIMWAHSFIPTGSIIPEWIGHSGSQVKITMDVLLDGVPITPIAQNDMTHVGNEIVMNVVGYCLHTDSPNVNGEVLQYTQNIKFRSDTGIEWSCPNYQWTMDGEISSGYLPQIATNNAMTLCTLPEANTDYNLSGDAGAAYYNQPGSGIYFWNPKTNWAVLAYVPSYVTAPEGTIVIQDRFGGPINKGYFELYNYHTISINDIISERQVFYRFKKFPNAMATLSKGGVTLTSPSFLIAPAITGTNTFNNVLTCDGGTCTGTIEIVKTYQWYVDGVAILGETNATYKVRAIASGKNVYCEVTASNGIGVDAVSNSNTITIASTAPVFSIAPAITGLLGYGDTLTCDGGTISGPLTISRTYQWTRNGVDIVGATNSTYNLVSLDSNENIYCEVTASNGGIDTTTANSNTVTANSFPPIFTVNPIVTGSLSVGGTLSCDGGTIEGQLPIIRTYEWFVDSISVGTSSSYIIQPADDGKFVYCEVTGDNGVLPNASANSNTSFIGTLLAPAIVVSPAITGLILQGETLTTTSGTWTNFPYSYTYQWQKDGVDIIGATSNTYVAVIGDMGHNITCDVTANNGLTTTETSNTLKIFETLLDIESNSHFYWSVFLRKASYYGSPCIQVRRSSDNALLDIGFVVNGDDVMLDTASLLSFVGAGDGFIVTKYSQINGYEITQSDPTAQPKIVSSGSLITQNSLPSTQYDGVNDYMTFDAGVNSFTGVTPNTVVAVAKFNATVAKQFIFAKITSTSNERYSIAVLSNTLSYVLRSGAYVGKSIAMDTNLSVITTTSSPQQLYLDSVASSGTTATSAGFSSAIMVLGRDVVASSYFGGYISEFGLFLADKTSTISSINTNLVSQYGT